jgi:proliferating cell nuclear antigen
MSKKFLLDVSTDNIAYMKAIFAMLQEITQDDVNLVFTKTKQTAPKKKFNLDSDDDDDNVSKKDVKKVPTRNGMKIRVLNSHNTLVAIIKLECSSFITFKVENEEMSFWLNIKEINKCLKDIETDGYTMYMCVMEDDATTLLLSVCHDDNTNRKEEYPLVFVENDVDIPPIPNINFDMNINMPSALFKKICIKAEKFSDAITIICTVKKITFEYETKTNKIIKIEYGNNSDDITITQINDKVDSVKAKYRLSDLLSFKNASAISDTMNMSLKEKNPLFINYIIQNDDDILGKMISYLSPSAIQNDDDYHDKTQNLYKDKKAVMKI